MENQEMQTGIDAEAMEYFIDRYDQEVRPILIGGEIDREILRGLISAINSLSSTYTTAREGGYHLPDIQPCQQRRSVELNFETGMAHLMATGITLKNLIRRNYGDNRQIKQTLVQSMRIIDRWLYSARYQLSLK